MSPAPRGKGARGKPQGGRGRPPARGGAPRGRSDGGAPRRSAPRAQGLGGDQVEGCNREID